MNMSIEELCFWANEVNKFNDEQEKMMRFNFE